MRGLLIEDDATTAKAIELMLECEGYEVQTTELGQRAVELVTRHAFDIIILDLGLPDLDGHEVLKRLRRAKIETPVLILSGLSEPGIKATGLRQGADDYLTKPFDRRELVARIGAVLRRAMRRPSSIVRVGALSIDLDAKLVKAANREIHLTVKEYEILELLATRKGMAVSKAMFLAHLYGGRDEPESKIIDVFICKLRKKLGAAADGASYIDTLWGRGYVLREPRTMEAAA